MSDKIDTQAQSIKDCKGLLTVPNKDPKSYAPFNRDELYVRTVFSDKEVQELKAIIKECLREFHMTNY